MNNSDRLCSECCNSRRYWSTRKCLRDIERPTHNDIAGAPDCSQERRRGRVAALYYGNCGFHGQYFSGCSANNRRVVYLAIRDRNPLDGYVFGSVAARASGMAHITGADQYIPATAEIIPPGREWLCKGRLVYLAIHDDGKRVTGYVFGSPSERDRAMAKYVVEGIYTAATAEIVEDVP